MKQQRKLKAKIIDGQIRCPRCGKMLCRIYYGGYGMGIELKCDRCKLPVVIEAPQRQ